MKYEIKRPARQLSHVIMNANVSLDVLDLVGESERGKQRPVGLFSSIEDDYPRARLQQAQAEVTTQKSSATRDEAGASRKMAVHGTIESPFFLTHIIISATKASACDNSVPLWEALNAILPNVCSFWTTRGKSPSIIVNAFSNINAFLLAKVTPEQTLPPNSTLWLLRIPISTRRLGLNWLRRKPLISYSKTFAPRNSSIAAFAVAAWSWCTSS